VTAAVARSGLFDRLCHASARFEVRDGWRVAAGFGAPELERNALGGAVGIADLSALGKLWIQGRNLGSILGSSEPLGALQPWDDGWVARLNRFEHYAVVPLLREQAALNKLDTALAGRHAHTTLVTHGRDVIALAGPRAADTLGNVCALDFHPQSFADRTLQTVSVAGVVALVVRCDAGELPCFQLHIERAYSRYLLDTCLDAACAFGGRLVGLEAWEAFPETII